jgi:hypothetical protein
MVFGRKNMKRETRKRGKFERKTEQINKKLGQH